MIFKRTKEGSVVTEDPKGGVTENFGRIQKEATQICLENEDMGGGGGSRKLSNVIREGHFIELTFKWGDQLNFTLFSTKSSFFNRWYYNLLVIS